MLEWEWYSDIKVKTLFLHLLLKANVCDKQWKGVDVKRGQLITGRQKLSVETGLSEKEIRTCIDKLKSSGEVAIKSASKFSIITLLNYNKFQDQEYDEGPANGPRKGQERASKGPQLKNERSKEELPIKNTPQTKDTLSVENLPACILPEVAQAFISHRKALKSPLTQYALELACKDAMKCQELYGIDPNDALRRVIAQGWKGCNPKYFEPKPDRVHRNGSPAKTARQRYMEGVGNLLEAIDGATANGCASGFGETAQPLPGIGTQPQNHLKVVG